VECQQSIENIELLHILLSLSQCLLSFPIVHHEFRAHVNQGIREFHCHAGTS